MNGLFCRLTLAIIFLLPLARNAEALTVPEYCQLTLELLQTSVNDANERLGAAQQNANNPSEYFRQLQTVEDTYKASRDQLYSKYGTTSGEYLKFMRNNKDAVNSYIQNHQEIRAQIDSLTSQTRALAQQQESVVVGAGLHRARPIDSRIKR